MKKIIKEGELLRGPYGIAYYRHDTLEVVAYLIPLNIIVSLLRKLWFFIKGLRFENGYDRGWRAGHSNAIKHFKSIMTESVEATLAKQNKKRSK